LAVLDLVGLETRKSLVIVKVSKEQTLL
jgi:hypothetical protein